MPATTPLRSALLLLALPLSLVVAAPASTQAPARPDLLLPGELAATGRRSVYDAVSRLRPSWVRMQSRGFQLADVAVYVDARRAGGLAVLHEMPVDSVLWIQYSTAAHARRRFDPEIGGPVIHVSTRLPLGEAHLPEVHRPSFAHRTTLRGGLFLPLLHGKETFFGEEPRGVVGAAIGVSFPAADHWSILLSARRGTLESRTSSLEMEASLSTLGIGLIYHMPASPRLSPYFGLSANAALVDRTARYPLRSPPGPPDEQSLAGWGVRTEVGVDTRVVGQLGLSVAGGIETNRLSEGRGASWLSLVVAGNWYMGAAGGRDDD